MMSKTTNTKEKGFEKQIVDYLVNINGYVQRENKHYDNTKCIDEDLMFVFLKQTNPKL